jgi:DNA-binding transcriptional LysR family regulator
MEIGNFSLEQLRTFAEVVEAGSFSAAARRLHRTQSAVTYLVQKLEEAIGTPLFDRSTYRASLTVAGLALLPRAQRVLEAAGALQQQARAMNMGIEPELAIVVDAMFPMAVLFATFSDFEAEFPTVQTRLFVESMGSTVDAVLRGVVDIGFAISFASHSPELVEHTSVEIELVRVAAPTHPLARLQQERAGVLSDEDVADQLQLVLTDRTDLTKGQDKGVLSARTWRLADLGAKHAMILAGLGWGAMPGHMVEADIAADRLVELRLSSAPDDGRRPRLQTVVIHRRDAQLGPAGRWLLNRALADGRPGAG